MKPIEFEGQNVVYAKDQPEYLPLPAHKTPTGEVITCWHMSPEEYDEVVRTGKVWVVLSTFNQPLQPMMVSGKPIIGSDLL